MKSQLPVKSEWHPVVYIENVSPTVTGGFAVKRVQGNEVLIQADVFTYRKASLAVKILFKHESASKWTEVFMSPIGNDRWQGAFLLNLTGKYQYKIKAWIDEAASWQQEVTQAAHEYHDIGVLLPVGYDLLKKMHAQANGEDQALMAEALRLFDDAKRADEAAQLASGFRFTEWCHRYPNIHFFAESETISVRSYRQQLEFSTWYTMFPRSSSGVEGKHGTFSDVSLLLPKIADMGFDILLFPPVSPIATTRNKGKNGTKKAGKNDPGSPYQVGGTVGGHDKILPAFGTVQEFAKLIDEAALVGIEIAVELSLEFSQEHPWLREHPDWFIEEKSQQPDLPGDITTQIVFRVDQGNWEETQNAVTQIVTTWAEWGIRILRITDADAQPASWWSGITTKVNSIFPEFIFYGGSFARPKLINYLAKAAFDLSDSYFIWRNHRFELENYVRELAAMDYRNYFRPIFWTNMPQINPYNLQSGHEPQFLIRLFLASTLNGVYGIYGPVFEQLVFEAFPGKERYWNAEVFEIKNWDWEKETKLTYLIRIINRIRKENPALQQGENMRICDVQNDNIIAYIKYQEKENIILAAVNLNAYQRQAGMVKVPLEIIGRDFEESYTVHDLVTDAKYVWKGEWNYVELDPFIMPFHLFRIEDYRGELEV